MQNVKPVPTVSSRFRSLITRVNGTSLRSALRGALKRLRRRRVPVIMQMSMMECGAACLAMILSFFGRKTQVTEISESCGVGRDGLTARTITKAARHYGLRVKAFSLEPAQFKHVPLPAVAHWNFSHFVVVERWSPQWVEIVDPALGRRRLTTEEFDSGFTGVALTFEPGVQFKRRRTAGKSSWRDYLKGILRLPGTPGVLVQIILASLVLQTFGLAVPAFTKVLVDHILPFAITNIMVVLGVGMAVVVLALMVTTYLRAAMLIYLEARLDAQMMLGFFEHVLSLPFKFFQQRTTGDLLMRLGSNAVIREALTNQTVSAVLDGGLVLVYLAILLALEPGFGLAVLGLGLVQIALLVGASRRVHGLMQRDLAAAAESQSYLVEALAGMATLKAAGAEERALDHWSNLFFKHLNISMQRNRLSAFINTALTTLNTLSPLVLLWIGARYVLDGSMSLGTMLALNALAASFLAPLASLVASGQQLQLVGAHLDRIADVVEAEPEQDLQATQSAPPLSGRIEVKHVSFRYDPNAPLVLRDISIAIEPGQKVALVGRTGSGKSTLAKLLLGLYTPDEGEIRYDDLPLQSLDYRTVRSQFGAVLQESFLFSGSIRQNIAFNDPGLSLEQVIEAARLAHIHDDIELMPMSYDTFLAEGGVSLSGGQRQRLSLARALAHRPAVLLLDEATSHLDAVTERLVDRSLKSLSCTRIVIAHRLSTIRDADLVLVLNEGEIVERGSHEELLAQGGYYSALVHGQLEIEADGDGLSTTADLLSFERVSL
jgi:ABC-type bacteriocin/lantibiotic exporter with double-glycine peptidase domain